MRQNFCTLLCFVEIRTLYSRSVYANSRFVSSTNHRRFLNYFHSNICFFHQINYLQHPLTIAFGRSHQTVVHMPEIHCTLLACERKNLTSLFHCARSRLVASIVFVSSSLSTAMAVMVLVAAGQVSSSSWSDSCSAGKNISADNYCFTNVLH